MPLGEWMRAVPLPDRPWLILGKGPTFAHRRHFDLTRFNLVSLNHVVREQRVDVAHFIDLDALVQCEDVLPANADWLMLPRYPHIDFRPSDSPLEELVVETPVLAEFAKRRRLVWYYHDLVSRPDLKNRYPPDASPIIRVDAFSAEAVVNVLAVLGAKTVRTLGIDGGIHYAGAFHDLNGRTRLANGQESFDKQFIGINKTAKEFDMDYGPLSEPIRVYVGTDESQMVAVQVLEYSIRRFATRPVEVVPLLNLPVPMPKDPANRPRTGFSFARFLIPSLAGYRGKGIYLDADMLVFGDIADLWDTPMGANRVLCTRQDTPPTTWQNNAHFQPGRQMSVMLIDCEKCQWNIQEIVEGLDAGKYHYRNLMCDLCVVPSSEIGENLDPMWNCLEHFEAGRTKLLHFTDMDMQPWRHQHNPLKSIWRAYYRAAVEAGEVDPALVEKGIAQGWLLPELADDLRFAPARMSQEPPSVAALAGTPSVRQRSLELEATALRAELGLTRLEAKISRHECYQQYVELGKVQKELEHVHEVLGGELKRMKEYAAELEEQVRTIPPLKAQMAAELHEQKVESHRQLSAMNQQMTAMNAQIARLESALAGMSNSWSWRIGLAMTKPARMARRLRSRAA